MAVWEEYERMAQLGRVLLGKLPLVLSDVGKVGRCMHILGCGDNERNFLGMRGSPGLQDRHSWCNAVVYRE